MYPAVPGPWRVIRRLPSSGILTAVPQSVNAMATLTTSPARPRCADLTNKFLALRSLQTMRASFNCSRPFATCSMMSSLTSGESGTPSRSMKSSRLPCGQSSVMTANMASAPLPTLPLSAGSYLSSWRVQLVYPCTLAAMDGRPVFGFGYGWVDGAFRYLRLGCDERVFFGK